MDGNLITLISIVVALIAIWKLRSVLGRRTQDDEARIDRQVRARAERERAAAAQGKVVALPRREREDAASSQGGNNQTTLADAEARVKTFATDPAIENGLLAILRADRSFDPEHFLTGAKQAYEMIVTAFAEGNRKMLKDLLSRDVMEGFSAAIAEREKRGEVIDQSFVGISKADIVEAELKNGQAVVTVKFDSQLISATRDSNGEVIAGDPQKIADVTDIWSFARDVSTRNPNWRLVATQSAG
ncbi:MAG: Tim44/TimA family putative adaptor protein [Hyphomicrobiaceae bacterium]